MNFFVIFILRRTSAAAAPVCLDDVGPLLLALWIQLREAKLDNRGDGDATLFDSGGRAIHCPCAVVDEDGREEPTTNEHNFAELYRENT